MTWSTDRVRYSLRSHGWLRILALLAFAGLVTTRANAVEIELIDSAPDRIERQRAHEHGRLPLPGTPSLEVLDDRLAAAGVAAGDPIFIRVFKAESELELWVWKDGAYLRLATYPVCHWSGGLGPKQIEGDRQTPEGFYTVTRRQLHLAGRWPRSLDLGFPNAFDRSHRRTGSYILIHGGCSSVGCFAMTNPVMAEIYGLAERALRNGQQQIHVHVFPFRMTADNLVAASESPWLGFWQSLAPAYRTFEATRRLPRIGVCEDRYVVDDRPSEAADPGPLAACGAPLSVTPPPPLANRSMPPRPSTSRRQTPPIAGHALSADAAGPRPMCRPALASCRKWLSLNSTRSQRARFAEGRNTGRLR